MTGGLKVSVHRVAGQTISESLYGRLMNALASQEDFELAEAGPGSGCVAILAAKRTGPETLEGIRELRSRVPKAAVVVVLERSGNGDVAKAVGAGAAGVLSAERIEDAAVATVRATAAGQLVIPSESRQEVRRQTLTMREKQILSLVVMGLTNGQIASKLFLAESTVKSHLSSAFTKLSVSSRHEAVTLILDPERGKGLGILTIPSERIATPA